MAVPATGPAAAAAAVAVESRSVSEAVVDAVEFVGSLSEFAVATAVVPWFEVAAVDADAVAAEPAEVVVAGPGSAIVAVAEAAVLSSVQLVAAAWLEPACFVVVADGLRTEIAAVLAPEALADSLWFVSAVGATAVAEEAAVVVTAVADWHPPAAAL